MIARALEKALLKAAASLPVVTLTGPRQSGKSTLLKAVFPHHRYVNLENPLVLIRAKEDPEGFLDDISHPVVIDEAQNFPELFSFIQLRVDEINEPGMYILSGSQNFLMMESIAQSLAGRVTVLRLYPFSASELQAAALLPETTEEWIFTGGYPRLYDHMIAAPDFYPSYIETYLQRDVRSLKNIGDLSAFMRFIQVLAGRVGQLLVYQELSDATDISVATVKSWLSVLETSYVITTLKPMHRNVTSRNVKSPKLYFWDTGLACSLLGLTNSDQLRTHYLYGALFENMVVVEMMKYLSAHAGVATLAFWRNNKKQEIDLLIETSPAEVAMAAEIKGSRSPKASHFGTLDKVGDLLGLTSAQRYVVYDGAEHHVLSKHGTLLPWRELEDVVKQIDLPA